MTTSKEKGQGEAAVRGLEKTMGRKESWVRLSGWLGAVLAFPDTLKSLWRGRSVCHALFALLPCLCSARALQALSKNMMSLCGQNVLC